MNYCSVFLIRLYAIYNLYNSYNDTSPADFDNVVRYSLEQWKMCLSANHSMRFCTFREFPSKKYVSRRPNGTTDVKFSFVYISRRPSVTTESFV